MVGVWVEVGVEVVVYKCQTQSRWCSNTFLGGWLVGWLQKWGLKLASTKVEVEVEAELSNYNSSIKKWHSPTYGDLTQAGCRVLYSYQNQIIMSRTTDC